MDESPIPVRETQSAIHPNAQRNAFRRPGARPQSRLPGVRTDGSKCQGPCQLHRVAAESLLIVGMANDPASTSSTIPARVDLRESDTRQGRRLEYFTLGWNLTEAVVGIGAGLIAGSIALVGFGVDSIIESFSGASLLWRLQSHETGEKREQLALKVVGISFFVLAAYVAVDAAKTLVQREPPDASIVGVCLAARLPACRTNKSRREDRSRESCL